MKRLDCGILMEGFSNQHYSKPYKSCTMISIRILLTLKIHLLYLEVTFRCDVGEATLIQAMKKIMRIVLCFSKESNIELKLKQIILGSVEQE